MTAVAKHRGRAIPSAKRLKVMVVVPVLGGGGAEMHVARLFAHLDFERFEAIVVCLRHGGELEGSLPDRVTILHACPPTVRSSTASAYLALPGLIGLLREHRPDVVCSFLSHSTAALYLALRVSRVRAALVVGLQNNPSYEQWSHPAVTWPLRRAYRGALRAASSVVALSDGVATSFAALYPDLAGKVCRIYNIGVDTTVIARAAEPIEEALPPGPLVVACGRLTAQKDYPTLLRAFSTVDSSPPAHLWILGRGELEPALETLARDLGLGDRVRFLGFRLNPFAYMSAADCFVLSSAWEGFANVLVEAMACGTPVVSTRCPFGPDEIITDGVNGLLAAVGDANALGNAMLRVLADREFAAALAAAGLTRAADFTPIEAVGLYQRVFEQAALECVGPPIQARAPAVAGFRR